MSYSSATRGNYRLVRFGLRGVVDWGDGIWGVEFRYVVFLSAVGNAARKRGDVTRRPRIPALPPETQSPTKSVPYGAMGDRDDADPRLPAAPLPRLRGTQDAFG